MACLVVLVVGLVGAQSAPLATFAVTTTADSGPDSLRQAIIDANAAAGADTITFDLDTLPYTITLATALPPITDPVTIDGTSELDFAGTPIIEINAAGIGNNDALDITAGNSTVRGLVINRVPFNGAAIRLRTNGANTIQGNYLGTNVAGTARLGNNRGIVLASSPNLIGGDTAAERNVISGSSQENIRLDVGGNTIQGNYIGTDATGATSLALSATASENGIYVNGGGGNNTIGGTAFGQGNLISGNGGNGMFISGGGNTIQGNLIGTNAVGTSAVCNETVGIAIGSSSSENVIGGADSGARNVISGNCGSGINLSGAGGVSSGNRIEANFIGTDITGTSAVPNNGAGIKLDEGGGLGTRNTVIGGIGTASANVIAMNGGAGVEVSGALSRLNTIRSNSIFDNVGLGIDLSTAGVTPNDPAANLDADTGPNDLQNFPVLNPDLSTTTEVAGTLDSAANEDYQIDVFSSPTCDASGSGEGKTRVASFTVTTNLSGNAGFGEQPLSPTAAGFLTATATHLESKTTSEFSSCLELGGGGGGGSLTGGRSAPSGTYDLTAEGSADWAVWGFSTGGEQCTTMGACSTTLAPDVRKTGGTGISNLTNINPGTAIPLRGIGFVTPQPFTFAWSSGSPTPSETNARTGLQHNGGPPTNASTLGTGFRFTVPADTTERTVKVWVALNRAGGELRATLSDGSDAAFSDSYNVATSDFVGAVYSLTYQAASPEQTLTVSWIENADNCTEFRCDNASIHAVALQGPGGGGGGEADPPVLFGAVPDLQPGGLGVAGLVEQDGLPAGTAFQIQFYSSGSCTSSEPSTLGAPRTVVTNANGVAAFALDGLPNVPVGTAVRATASLGGDDESDFSNCVIADRNNTSWPTARTLSANATDNGFLRSSGQARWFKVPVLPSSRVDVTLSDLPADYDLVVFGDIQAAYTRMNGGQAYTPANGPNLALDDLNRQGAEAPTDVFNTSQYNPSSWDATNWDPTLNTAGFSPSEWSPSEWSPSEWSASQWSPSEWSPSEWSPSEWSPSEWSPSEWSPSEWSPTQWSPSEWSSSNPADPRTFSTAQTSSILAVSGGTGTGDESVSVNTWNNTGFLYIRVQGKNGSFVPTDDFSLQVSREGNLCQGVGDQASTPSAPPGDRNTVILYDSSRMAMGSTLPGKLSTLAARPDVRGALVNVSGDPAVNALNAQADTKKGCPYAKNLVASAITRIVDAYRANNPIKYVVVVGDDSVIPFYRYPDPALLGNETLYVPPVKDDTASQASLRLGFVLNQDGYGSSDSVSLHGNQFPVPDLAIGRLVETPAEIEGMIDAYLGTAAGVVPTPTSSLVTGYDFLQDAADTVQQHLSAGIGGANAATLITNRTVSPQTVTVGTTPDRNHSWTGADLRRSLLNSGRHDLIFLAGHFSANDALGADYRTNVLSTELPASATSFVNSIVFSAGCHAGYNIVNGDATQVTEPLDWAQAFARKRATLISGTGYQYGDTEFLAHSERIYAEFARQLRITTGAGPVPVAVGDALLRSKRIFLESTPGLSSLDEKALLQTTLFGLPMLSVNLPQGRIVEASDGTDVPSVAPVGPGPGADLGLRFANVGVGGGLTPGSVQLDDGPLATFLSGPDGVAVRPTQPILPLQSLNVTSPVAGLALRGVAFRGGSYTDTNGVTPLTAAPATELRGVHAPFFTDVFFPLQPWTTNFFDAVGDQNGSTRLHVTPVQHRSNFANLAQSTRRQFSNLDLRLFYSGNLSSYCPGTSPLALAPCSSATAVAPALAAPPTITGIDTSFAAGQLTFKARVVGELVAGIQSVWVTWTIPPGAGQTGGWESLDLEVDPDDPTLWTATLALPSGANPGNVHFLVQAVNGVGRVTIDDNVGAFYRPGSIPGTGGGATEPAATAMAFTSAPPASVSFGASFDVTARLTAGGNPVANKLVFIGLGASGLPAFTNASGEATVTVRAALTPSTYSLTASFAGDATHAASNASQNVDVVAQPTTLTLTGTLGTQTQDNSLSIVATLRDTKNPPAALHQRTIFVVFRGTGTGMASTGVTRVFSGKTDPLGQVVVPASFLVALPGGSYDVDAFFNGVNLPGVLVLGPDDVDYGPSNAHATLTLRWPFSGFFGLQNPPAFNSKKAGTAVPVKFSLGFNRGLGIFASGYPKIGTINCTSGAPIGNLSAAQNSGFRFDTANGHYTYDLKTDKGWTGCRQLILRFADGSERVLRFKFS